MAQTTLATPGLPLAVVRLAVNTATIEIEPQTYIQVGLLPYENKEQLKKIRQELRGTHLVVRSRSEIQVVALRPDANPFGAKIQRACLNEDLKLLCALTHERLIAIFSETGHGKITNHRPVGLTSSLPDDDLLKKIVREEDQSRIPSWLARKVRYEFEARHFEQVGKEPIVLLSIGTRTENQIDANCRELQALGVLLKGRYVEVVNSGDDERLRGRRDLVGRVDRIEKGIIHLVDPRQGWSQVKLEDAYLEPRDQNLEAALVAAIGRDGNHAAERLRNASGAITSGPSRHRRAGRLLGFIKSRGLTLAPGIVAKAGELLASENPIFPAWEVFQTPTMIFHPSGKSSHAVPYTGLDKYGPYDHAVFNPKQPRIALICQGYRQGDAETFIQMLFDGVPGHVFGKGMLRRFGLKQPVVEIFCAKDRTASAYESACLEAVDRAAETQPWDLALVQTEDEFKDLAAPQNPYLVTKAVLYRHQTPVQAFTLRTMGMDASKIPYALNNLSLACYAKLGGTPWVLDAGRTVAHELVIGLRSYKPLESRFSTARYVGLTTVFKGDGQYLLEGRTRAVPFEEYSSEMLETLSKAVKAVREQQNWDGRDRVRMIFHAFKPMKAAEINAVRTLMNDLGLPNAEFAFLRMVEDHPFSVMDTEQKGVEARGGHAKKGIMAPPRGLFLTLGKFDALVAFKGANSVKRPTDGLPRPVMLRLHPSSTFRDMTYLARQAFNFSCHSWRTFNSADMPITVGYSGYIAELLGQLRGVPGWSDDSMLDKIGRTRWFL